MNLSRPGLAVALLSAMCVSPSHVFAIGGSTGSPILTEVSSCSDLTSSVDKGVCSYHLSAFKEIIREKNRQLYPTTHSVSAFPTINPNISLSTFPGRSPDGALISEAVMIRKISATTRLDHEAFRTTYPTLFIFDAERFSGKGLSGKREPVVYELPLTRVVSDGSRRTSSFQLPDNSAFVGNRTDILPEFVVEGGIQNHFVMSASHNDAVYYLANIEIDSRNPLTKGAISTAAPTGRPVPNPTKRAHVPVGILDLKGAGIFMADNIKVVLDPADNRAETKPVKLGCTNDADGRGAKESFIYRFTHSEFDLLQSTRGPKNVQNAALNVDCYLKTGHVQLTMKNTKTVISVPTKSDTLIPRPADNKSVLFSMSLWPRKNVLSLVDSTCNTVVDQHDNDLSIDLMNLLHPHHYMGGIGGSSKYCSDIKTIQGAFGLKDREEAWGLTVVPHTDLHSCSTELEKKYQLGFASLSEWSASGFDVACHCTTPTSILSTSSGSFRVSPYTTQVAYTSPAKISGEGAPAIEGNGTKGLTDGQKAGLGISLFIADQGIAHIWFCLSNRIRQVWIRHTSQLLAAAIGLGIPTVQLLIPKCDSGLRGRKIEHIRLAEHESPL